MTPREPIRRHHAGCPRLSLQAVQWRFNSFDLFCILTFVHRRMMCQKMAYLNIAHPLFMFVLAPAMLTACAGAATLVRPDEATAGSAMGETKCNPALVGKDGSPFAVDWPDNERAALESAMTRGVAVVKYSCEGVEVLKGCSVQGDYAYRGISKKTKVIQMNDAASVAANLGPTGVPVAVQAELRQGRSLDLAYVMVGSESTTVQSVSRDMLQGRCEGATHFVYEANLGAFALGTAASGEARSAAQVFGTGGVDVSGQSDKSTKTMDGDVAACDAATDEAKSKVGGCAALVRVTLFSVASDGAEKGTSPSSSPLVAPDTRSCPAGFSFVDDVCVQGANQSQLCEPGDISGCKTQCVAGSAASCGRLSTALIQRSYTPNFVIDRAEGDALLSTIKGLDAPLKKACKQGEGAACWGAALAVMARRDEPDFMPEGADVPELIPAMEEGCKLGDAMSCANVVFVYGDGLLEHEKTNSVRKNIAKMIDIVGVGCDRGGPMACLMLGAQIAWDERSGSPEERSKIGLQYLRRACAGGLKEGCAVAGAMQLPATECAATIRSLGPELQGNAIHRQLAAIDDECGAFSSVTNAARAKEDFARGCRLGSSFACTKKK